MQSGMLESKHAHRQASMHACRVCVHEGIHAWMSKCQNSSAQIAALQRVTTDHAHSRQNRWFVRVAVQKTHAEIRVWFGRLYSKESKTLAVTLRELGWVIVISCLTTNWAAWKSQQAPCLISIHNFIYLSNYFFCHLISFLVFILLSPFYSFC